MNINVHFPVSHVGQYKQPETQRECSHRSNLTKIALPQKSVLTLSVLDDSMLWPAVMSRCGGCNDSVHC